MIFSKKNLSNVYAALEKKIGIKFKNHHILENAFIHRSFINEDRKNSLVSNERLEFLGDAVLELAVTEYLYKNFPNPEGELTNWRSALVKGENLAKITRHLELNQYLKLSKGEERSGGREKNYLLANLLEALLGAIYLDRGFKIVEKFIQKFILIDLKEILEKGLHIDAKSHFQEIAQEKINITPVYEVLKEVGPDHNKKFTIGAYLGEKLVGTGVGPSKQSGQQSAARAAMKNKKWR